MKKRGADARLISMKISDGAVLITLQLYEPQFIYLKNILQAIDHDRYFAQEITCSSEGLLITGDEDVIKYRPDFLWNDFVQELPLKDFDLKGQELATLFDKYNQWAKDKSAEYALADLDSGKTSFAELENLAPYLKDHPDIQRKATYCAFSNAMPTRKGRRKKDEPPETQLLIQWVAHYRGVNNLSIEVAVGRALTNHPELVPPHWTEPEDALAKAYKRSIQKRRANQSHIT